MPEVSGQDLMFVQIAGLGLMGRGRGKGRKLAVVTSSEDPGSGSEEVLPACRRRGRPHEPLKDDIEEDVPEKTEEGDDVVKLDAPNKKLEGLTVAYGKKRRYSKAKQKSDMVMEENGSGSESKNGDSTRFSGFRHNGSRRKSKPRRAAEAGVECKFHQLPEFDQGKRSCRRRLAGHNERRRKPPPGPFGTRYGRIASSFHEDPSRFRSFLVDFSYPNFSCAARDVWPTARPGDRMANNEWRGVLDAPSHAAALHGTHPSFQGPPVGAFCSPMELPPGECLAGVSDSSCALSLLSTDPWSSNSAGNRSPVIPASGTFDGQPTTHSVIPSNYFNSSWGTRGHGARISSHEIQHEMGLAGGTTNVSDAHFTGQVEFAPQENGHCLDHGSDRAYDHSVTCSLLLQQRNRGGGELMTKKKKRSGRRVEEEREGEMATRPNGRRLSYIAVPSQIIHSLSSTSLHSLLLSPPKKVSRTGHRLLARGTKFLLLLLFVFAGVGTLRVWHDLDPLLPCPHLIRGPLSSAETADSTEALALGVGGGVEARGEFWRQPDGMGYVPCPKFSKQYRAEGEAAARAGRRKKYLLVVVSGGLNQQRNQIVDAVVIARILGAALVVPVLQVNVIWGDESEFSDVFDLEHFKTVIAEDVKVVSSLPSTHIMTRPVQERETPLHVSPDWIRSRYMKRLNREGVLLLRGLDSRLSKDLPPDLQKLRCKVAFLALRFAAPIQELGNKLAMRMRSKGPYLALHLRLEKDVWVRTGCLPGLSPDHDVVIQEQRKLRPKLLTGRSNMTYQERRLAGLCPLTAMEVTRLLKALEAPREAQIYWAGGEPFGGREALLPLLREFPNLYNKESLTLPGELEQFANRSSLLAAIDYIVCEQSDVFMASHGGNMGHLMRGHRAFAGHKKFITPNKRQMIPYFLDTSLPESEFNRIVKELHQGSLGQPELRTDHKVGRDVTAYPVPECMCNGTSIRSIL
ncbi:unnamed protein product [Musa textilis]